MTVGEFCNRKVVIARQDSSIVEIAKLMRQYHVGDLVIVEEGQQPPRPIGIITDRDIVVELVAGEVPLDSVTVGDVMSYDLITARERDGIWDTIRLMRARGIRRLPVVNELGGLEGILTADDLLELFGDELTGLAGIAEREVAREKQKQE